MRKLRFSWCNIPYIPYLIILGLSYSWKLSPNAFLLGISKLSQKYFLSWIFLLSYLIKGWILTFQHKIQEYKLFCYFSEELNTEIKLNWLFVFQLLKNFTAFENETFFVPLKINHSSSSSMHFHGRFENYFQNDITSH